MSRGETSARRSHLGQVVDHLIDPDDDNEASRLIVESFDRKTLGQFAGMTFGAFREWVLDDRRTTGGTTCTVGGQSPGWESRPGE